MAVTLLGFVMPMAHVAAVLGGNHSTTNAAQVRIFGNDEFTASGTLVHRNWVLTARHAVQPSLDYTVRFGVINSRDDSASNRRVVDRIVQHPDADLALIHFAEPVSPYTWIPRLATASPQEDAAVRQYGWGPDGTVLKRLLIPVVDPVATENAAALRSSHQNFNVLFPPGVEPMVLDLFTQEGDSGAGTFGADGSLLGVHSAMASYRQVNGTGNPRGIPFPATYNQPVWPKADWIRRVINGEGSSSSSPPAAQSSRRQLAEKPAGNLPMTQPPQDHVCDPGDNACSQPDPNWRSGTLTGGGNYRGIALARCSAAGDNSCSFNGTNYSAGAEARIPLGPSSSLEAPGKREVLSWCTTEVAFPTANSPSRQVLRVSFTNDEQEDTPVGYGWWDLTPDQVTDPTTQKPLDPSRLNTC